MRNILIRNNQSVIICGLWIVLLFHTLSIAQDVTSPRQAIQAIQDRQTLPAGSDSQLQIYVPSILAAKGRFEYDDDGAVIGLDFSDDSNYVSDDILPSILYFTELKKLRISGDWSPNTINQLLRLSKLEELCLQDTFIDDETFAHLSQLPHLTSLTVWRASKLTDASLSRVEKFTGLTTLSLIDLQLSDAVCKSIAKINTLKTIDLRGCSRMSVEGMRHLTTLPSLETFRLGGKDIDDRMVIELANFSTLKSLTLEECNVTSRWTDSISKLKLDELVLIRCELVDDGMIIPILISQHQLKRLTVCDCQLTRNTLSRIKSKDKLMELQFSETLLDDSSADFLAECVHLKRLELRATQITDATLEKIAKLEELEYLHLQGTAITDAGLKKLSDCTSLRYLNIAQTAVSEIAAQEFQQAHPRCVVDRRMAP